MPLLRDQIRRIFERLKELRSHHAAQSQQSVEDVAEALENVTEAVHQIEQRRNAYKTGERSRPVAAELIAYDGWQGRPTDRA
jgi:flagellar biosynthesis chaperone FliJ